MEALRPLAEWISANGGRAKFARDVGCSEPHLSEILSGKKTVSLKLAIRMSRATGGAVPVEAFEPTEQSELAPCSP